MSVFQRGTRKIGCRRRTGFCSCGVFIEKGLLGSGRSALLKVQPLHASSIARLRSSLVSIASPPLGVLTYFDGGIKGCRRDTPRRSIYPESFSHIIATRLLRLAAVEGDGDALCDGERERQSSSHARSVCPARRRTPEAHRSGVGSSSMVVFSDLFQFLSNACAVHRESVRLGCPINRARANAKQSGQPEGNLSPFATCGAGEYA
jgi:hypothetical protein